MKKSKNIVLIVTPVLSAALFNACGSSSQPYTVVNTTTTTTTPAYTPYPTSSVAAETAQTRDVYNNLNDCVKDWGSKELCEQMSEEDDKDYKKKHKTTGTGTYFFGPGYSSRNRIITYKGKTVSPTGKATKLPSYVSAVSSSKTTSSTTTSSSKSSTVPSSSSTSKSTTSSTLPSSSTSSSSSTSATSPSSSYSTTTRSGFGSTSSSSSSSSSGS